MEPLNFSAWMAQQRVLEASDIVPADDLIAIGKKINKKGRDGEQYKEFAMTLEELFKLGLNGYTTVQDAGVSLPQRSIINFIGAAVTDLGGKTVITIPTPTISLVEDITYAALVVKVGASTLEPGKKYNITDFATRHIIPNSGGTPNTGSTEALIVTAIAANKLDMLAESTTYPQDIIHYELVDSSTAGGDKGRIFYREDTKQNISTYYDWRTVLFRRFRNAQTLSLVPGGASLFIYGGKITGSISGAVGYIVGGAAGFLRVINHAGLFVPGDVLSLDGVLSTRIINTVADYSTNTDTHTDTGRAFSDILTFVTADATGIVNVSVGNVGASGPIDRLNNITFSATCSDIILADNCYNSSLNSITKLVTHGLFYDNYITGSPAVSSNNVFFKDTYGNKIYSNFSNNIISGAFLVNTVVYGFTDNNIMGQFSLNNIARNFANNVISHAFGSSNVDTIGFQYNLVNATVSVQTFLQTATIVSNSVETKRILKGTDTVLYLEYYNGAALVYVDPLTA